MVELRTAVCHEAACCGSRRLNRLTRARVLGNFCTIEDGDTKQKAEMGQKRQMELLRAVLKDSR